MKNNKVTLKINKEVYRELQIIKANNGLKSVGDVISKYIFSPTIPIQKCIVNEKEVSLMCADVYIGSDMMSESGLTANLVIDFEHENELLKFINDRVINIELVFESAGDWYRLKAKDFYADFIYSTSTVACIYIFIEDYMKLSDKENVNTNKALKDINE